MVLWGLRPSSMFGDAAIFLPSKGESSDVVTLEVFWFGGSPVGRIV